VPPDGKPQMWTRSLMGKVDGMAIVSNIRGPGKCSTLRQAAAEISDTAPDGCLKTRRDPLVAAWRFPADRAALFGISSTLLLRWP